MSTKILCIIPPYIPSYFNAGHHLHIFLISAYLRKNTSYSVSCYDCAALNYNWKDICDILIEQYDVIILLNDYDAIDSFSRFIKYSRNLSGHAKIITVGRLSKEIPQFFINIGCDAVQFEGDYEAGALAYLNYLSTNDPEVLAGILLAHNSPQPGKPGTFLKPDEWCLPDVSEIPYQAYHRMYQNDLNKFCGIPDRQELIVPVARGCPIGCFYCDVPAMQGHIERRLNVDDTISYIRTNFHHYPFEYVAFYAPTFTLNKKWVLEFCKKIQHEKRIYPWKCATALSCLNEELIAAMAKAGCVRISFGIETLSKQGSYTLPKCKQNAHDKFMVIAQTMQKYNVEMNVFLMFGLPGDQPEDVENTIQLCLKRGIRIRPTIYTPYHQLNSDMTVDEINNFNRQLFLPGQLAPEIAHLYYKFFYKNEQDSPTRVMTNIAKI